MTSTAHPTAVSRHGVIAPVDGEIVLGEGLLGRWQRRNRRVTIPHGIERLETEGALDNLRGLIGETDAPFRGPVFADSDVHKVLEAVAWELGHGEDPALRRFYEDTVALLAAVQDEDGYLDSAFQRADRVQRRWTDFAAGHELYCTGHLIQAAVASVRALGDDRLLAAATRAADLVVRLFGGPESPAYPGHPEIEYALVELYRLTGRAEYLDTAKAFIDRRGSGWLGRGAFGAAYFQDDAPLRETTVMRGHAVRALYLNSGATDVFLETGDDTLLRALTSQWDDMATRRSYLTGGTGSRHRDEAFGDAYELPSDRAYAETCAGIGAMHWAWRMYQATGKARFGDFFETALYNVVADGVSEDGAAFFYSNPLQLRPDHVSVQEEAAARRLGWYFCACCPPNLMRTFASIEGYLAGTRGAELQLLQYTASHIETRLVGERVVLDVDTEYPLDGRIRITVVEGGGGTLALRIPSWCVSHEVTIDGRPLDVPVDAGWLRLDGALTAGSVVVLELGMPARVLTAHRRVDAVRGCVAVRRGPIVYCLEQGDNASDVDDVAVDPSLPIVVGDGMTPLGPAITARGGVRRGDGALYSTLTGEACDESVGTVELRMRPYATWGNGRPGAMRVWVPVS
ncbi:MAG TPA: beta-L-arabinofuranosidase domain-containing protein [Lacisediminihabitans sp.]|uniref:glycoside hydrolase family 127 protein n=1 Tax=Lacisediminihabitans sp. TaxID=2787631 RepID=UPI002EDAA6A0